MKAGAEVEVSVRNRRDHVRQVRDRKREGRDDECQGRDRDAMRRDDKRQERDTSSKSATRSIMCASAWPQPPRRQSEVGC